MMLIIFMFIIFKSFIFSLLIFMYSVAFMPDASAALITNSVEANASAVGQTVIVALTRTRVHTNLSGVKVCKSDACFSTTYVARVLGE
jgi:mannose/fructose/N-acetylgalactosamine-specific phosphotransferase system component IID